MTAIEPSFIRLNEGWNAEPNAPHPRVTVSDTVSYSIFFLTPFYTPNLILMIGALFAFLLVREIASERPMMKAGTMATFECIATHWELEPDSAIALFRHLRAG